jgi:beta-galactosidase
VAYYHLANTHHDPPTYDYTPSMLGEDFDKAKFFGKDPIEVERATVKSLDPVRIAFAGSGGGKYEPVHSSMNYISIDADLQVHETWPSHWYKHRKKPLALNEMEVPSFQKNWYRRTSRGQETSSPIIMETAAIHLGEEPYSREPRAHIMSWLDPKVPDVGLTDSWSHQATCDLFVERVFRSWRTYGVNMGFWCMFVRYFGEPRMSIPPIQVDPRRPDPIMDNPAGIWHWPVGPMTREGALAKKGLSPLLAYIGGPDGDFAYKDRSHYAGERIRKAVVVVNDTELEVNFSGTWELATPDGKRVTGGTLPDTHLAPGELAPAKVHIEFTAPVVEQRTDYLLKLEGKADRDGHMADTFALTVFPKEKPPVIPEKMKLYLYDPVGDTKKMLEAASVSFEMLASTLPPPQGSILIVGRNALKDEENRKRLKSFLRVEMTYDFRVNTSNGMRVLVFEQAMDNIWGLNTEQTRWRRSFITAAGHPVFDGLTNDDFQYLRGDASLVDPYPGPHPEDLGRLCIDRYPDWGNDNTVVTYAITRPQKGACRSLLSCGFDLQESSLLEFAAGQGRMMFCQVDVHGRYGKDPVSTRLVNNILTYVASAAPPVVSQTIDLVREGWEDYGMNVKKETVFMVDRPAGPISWGITLADLYFQEKLELPVIQGENGEKYLYAKLEREKAFMHLLNARSFNTRWQKMKAMQIRAALLINQGGSSDDYPNPFLQDDREMFYPMEWLEGFIHPYPMMQW